MELCSDNLQNIIQQMPQYFGRKESETMEAIEYFISCQLFQEVLECVQYLHESKPPIIHGNLKMENILVSDLPRNGRFLKLCDLKFENIINADEYEGINGDINSLGLILQKIFHLNANS